MSTILKDTISGVTVEYDDATAKKWLAHPVFGKRLEIARVDKPEVLGQERVIDHETGEKVPAGDDGKPAKEEKK